MATTPNPERALARALRAALARAADPKRAPAMQAYMKSPQPFLGVGSNERRAIERTVFALHPFDDADGFRRAVATIWRGARHREERYAAVDLLIDRRYAKFLDWDALPLIEEMVTSGAWWDFVDTLAAHAVGTLLRKHPAKMKKKLLAWAKSKDLWKRRAAILSQLRFKDETDTALLYACIEPSLDHPDFFMRKGIGWALRQYGWTNPREVRRKVAELGERLSPLSRREALKSLPAKRKGSR
jgi:3-methyladenine DNA glycosylase AlkD